MYFNLLQIILFSYFFCNEIIAPLSIRVLFFEKKEIF